MFTGIVEEVGRVVSLKDAGGKKKLTVSSSQLVRELKKGGSIAVSGVCLTAIDINRDSFTADLAHETVARTSFIRLAPNAVVNLELPTRADGRLGGHIVQGHVDGVGQRSSLERVEGAEDFWLEVEIPEDLARYVAWKGSIAIEGISLTVAKVEGNVVGVAIIPHTREATNLHSLKPGDPVNIETDIIAKYTEKMLKGEAPRETLSVEKLVRQGF
jgi:riboflavin synthase, alpha subunit